MRGQRIRPACLVLLLYIAGFPWQLEAHEHDGHRGPTYQVTQPIEMKSGEKKLQLTVIDQETGKPTAARFSLVVKGASYTPHGLGKNGLRFVSIHQGRKQRFVALYARGSGDVEVPLPTDARSGVVFVTKGFEFFPEQISFEVKGDTAKVTIIPGREDFVAPVKASARILPHPSEVRTLRASYTLFATF